MGYIEILWIINSTFAKGEFHSSHFVQYAKHSSCESSRGSDRRMSGRAISGQICLVAGAENTKNKLKKVIKTII